MRQGFGTFNSSAKVLRAKIFVQCIPDFVLVPKAFSLNLCLGTFTVLRAARGRLGCHCQPVYFRRGLVYFLPRVYGLCTPRTIFRCLTLPRRSVIFPWKYREKPFAFHESSWRESAIELMFLVCCSLLPRNQFPLQSTFCTSWKSESRERGKISFLPLRKSKSSVRTLFFFQCIENFDPVI